MGVPNAKPWTEEEELELLRMKHRGDDNGHIAEVLGRSANAVNARYSALTADDRDEAQAGSPVERYSRLMDDYRQYESCIVHGAEADESPKAVDAPRRGRAKKTMTDDARTKQRAYNREWYRRNKERKRANAEEVHGKEEDERGDTDTSPTTPTNDEETSTTEIETTTEMTSPQPITSTPGNTPPTADTPTCELRDMAEERDYLKRRIDAMQSMQPITDTGTVAPWGSLAEQQLASMQEYYTILCQRIGARLEPSMLR